MGTVGCQVSTIAGNGTVTFANRYSLRGWSHNNIDKAYSYNDSKIFQKFVQEVNSQDRFNKANGTINAVLIIGYHDIINNNTRDADANLFAQEMKYLHDNGFKVLLLNQLGYDTKHNAFYLKNSADDDNTAATTTTTALRAPTITTALEKSTSVN